jgi:hypothetical protein
MLPTKVSKNFFTQNLIVLVPPTGIGPMTY